MHAFLWTQRVHESEEAAAFNAINANYTHVNNIVVYSGTPLNGHPWKADTHDIKDNSESPDCPSIHFNT